MSVTNRLWAVALATVAFVVACDRVPLTSPTGSTISVQVSETTIPVGGQVSVQAIVTESSGTPVHNGTQVNFTSSLGTFNPPASTTVNGVATTMFSAGTVSGTTKINAYSGGASTGSGNSSSGGIEVKIGAAAAGSVSLQVIPPTVPQNGGTVQATAFVFDPAGNPLRGVPVQFSVDAGTLSAALVNTNSDGQAVTNLVTTRAATITARVGTATPATFSVGVSAAATVTLEAVTTSPVANQPMAFRITPSTATNASPLATVLVELGDGTSRTFTNITGPTGFTHTYTRQGGYTVTATATDINGGRGVSSISIIVGFENLPTISAFSANPNPVTPASQGLTTITVTPGTPATGAAPIRNVRVTLADGTIIFNSTGGGSFAYKFGGGGTYNATATVTDALGATATATIAIVVQPW